MYPVLATGPHKGWPVHSGAFYGTLPGQAIVLDAQIQVCISLHSLVGEIAKTVDNLTCPLVTRVTGSKLLLLGPQLKAGGEQTLSAPCAGHLNTPFQQPNEMYQHYPHFTNNITETHEGLSNISRVTLL